MWGEAGWMEGGLIHSPVIGALLFPDFVADYWSRKNVQRRPPVMKPTTEIPAASLYLCIFQQTEKMLLFHIIHLLQLIRGNPETFPAHPEMSHVSWF